MSILTSDKEISMIFWSLITETGPYINMTSLTKDFYNIDTCHHDKSITSSLGSYMFLPNNIHVLQCFVP